MKKVVVFISAAFLFTTPFIASADERIKEYVVHITIQENSNVEVFETITYDFGESNRHGIFRDIPIKYDANIGNREVRLNVKSVSRDGFEEPFTEKRTGDDKRLKIGDADITITGEHVYRIGYTVRGAFNDFNEFDELYWNAVPHGWNVPIDKAIVKVTAPSDFLQGACYVGEIGSTIACSGTISGAEALYEGANLDIYNGITIAVALPNGAVELPTPLTRFIWWLSTNFVIFIPLFVFFYMYRRWDEKGRDAKGRGTIIPQYQAPIALTPLYLGTVVDGTLHDNDITADIIYLAEQGFLTINRIEEKKFLGTHTDYVLEWTGKYDDLAKKERLVAELLFGDEVTLGEQVTLSELQKDTSLHKKRKELRNHIDDELKRQGYFANKPHKTRETWIVWPIVIGSFLFVFWFVNILLSIALSLSVVIVIIFGSLMPKRTKKGAEIREHILGFKQFLSITEAERLDFHNAPERSPTEFMENLPYAIALGVEKKWAKQFESIHIDNPSWYRGNDVANFTAASFVTDLNSFGTSMKAGVTATASQGGSGSGGGGFSGGGVGGGGGGSW